MAVSEHEDFGEKKVVDFPSKTVSFDFAGSDSSAFSILYKTPIQQLPHSTSLSGRKDIDDINHGVIESCFSHSKEISQSGALFLGFVDKMGRLQSSSLKSTFLANYTNTKDEKNALLFMEIALEYFLHKDLDCLLGSEEFTVTYRKDYKTVMIPLSTGVLYAVMQKQSDHDKFVELVRAVLDVAKHAKNTRTNE